MVLYAQIITTLSPIYMLKIGKLTDYAMLIMSELARDSHSILSASLLSEILHLSKPTVSKILKMLSEADLVNSVRGAEGGYYLAREAKTITVTDVIAAMEGKIAMTECCKQEKLCVIERLCTMRENWKSINTILYSVLAKFSILDMAAPISIQGLINDK